MSLRTISPHDRCLTDATGAVPFSAAELYRMNVSEYERLVSLGALDDPRIELIDGYLVRNTGKNPPHVWSIDPAISGYRSRQDYPRGSEAPVILDGIERGRVRVDNLLPGRSGRDNDPS